MKKKASYLEQKPISKYMKTTAFFLPSILLLAVFFIGPMLLTFGFSFTNISLTGANATNFQFVKLENFARLIKDDKFFVAFKNTIIFLVFSGLIGQQFLGFISAYLMKKRNPIIRRLVALPIIAGWICPETVCAFIFSSFFADKGTLNSIIGFFGKGPIAWLFAFPMVSVIIANVWKGSAYSMMMFQAALDNIPEEIEEAAAIDGANSFQILRYIILPMISNTLGTVFIVVTLSTIGSFGLIYMLTGGGPGSATTTLSVYMYQRAFIGYQIGYGTAISLVMLAIGIALSLVYVKIVDKE